MASGPPARDSGAQYPIGAQHFLSALTAALTAALGHTRQQPARDPAGPAAQHPGDTLIALPLYGDWVLLSCGHTGCGHTGCGYGPPALPGDPQWCSRPGCTVPGGPPAIRMVVACRN